MDTKASDTVYNSSYIQSIVIQDLLPDALRKSSMSRIATGLVKPFNLAITLPNTHINPETTSLCLDAAWTLTTSQNKNTFVSMTG